MSGPKKYGLYIPPKKPQTNILTKNSGLFDDSDNDTSEVKSTGSIETIDLKKRQIEKMQEKALAEDPSIFQYDEAFEPPPKQSKPVKGPLFGPVTRSGPSEIPKKPAPPPPPKYMENLLQKAAERKAMNDVVRVRLMRKEVALEAEKYADKESFVTAGYKKKLESLKDRMEAEVEEDVTAHGDMTGFYRNLLKNNVAFGAGKGGRIHQGGDIKKAPEVVRYGASASINPPQVQDNDNNDSDDDEEESFGPVRKK